MSVIDDLLAAEGGYTDNPADRGGPTCYGITQAAAREHGYTGDMKDLPLELARSIYEHRYIVEPAFDRVAEIDQDIANELIDGGVNMGPATSSTFFQRVLNVFNEQGTKYADVFVDGRIGNVSLDALHKFLAWRGPEGKAVLLKALHCLRGARYIDIAEHTPTQEGFIYGWMRNRVHGT